MGIGQKRRLEFSAGDLIVLDKNSNGETIEETGGGYGTCQRTGLSGKVFGAVFYIIPTTEAPDESLLVRFHANYKKLNAGNRNPREALFISMNIYM